MTARLAGHVAGMAELALGRRNLARLGRVLGDRARLDVPNGMETNGELDVQAVVVRHAGPGRLVAVDAGANRGEWTRHLLEASAASGVEASVHAFEPSGFTFGLLAAALEGSTAGRVELVNQGLSNEAGEATLYQVKPGAGSNSLHGAAGSTAGLLPERVTVTTLDAYCAATAIEHIDLLKVDAEGHDLLVLDGARHGFGTRAIDVAQFEYNYRWIGARRYLKDAFDLLEPLGYRIGKITPRGIELYTGWHPELETFREANFVAIRADLVGRFVTFPWWNQTQGFEAGGGPG